ncbi:glycosyltransferase [Winogradskyella sp.]|nr:glycosyltransferase [Winogradskyella sp.]
MKILITCDPEIPVPPTLYGGVERLVDGLAHAYTAMGHEVYLLANPASTCTAAKEIFAFPALHSRGYGNVIKNALKLYKVAKKVKPDVVHSFSRLLYTYPLLLTTNLAFLQTYGRFISPKSTKLASMVGGKKIHFTSAAGHMLKHLKNTSKFTPIYNFVDVNYFKPDKKVEKDHLMFLGRIEDIKGTKECIEVALATNNKLIIAGNIQEGHDEYFDTHIKPHLENDLIDYVGPVNDEQKLFYLQRSKAFLFPIKWEEPFGIVMAEALACGTPVVAFKRGSVPEVVKANINGFVVDNLEEMISCTQSIESIDRVEVRNDCVKRFSREVISQQYSALLNEISGGN